MFLLFNTWRVELKELIPDVFVILTVYYAQYPILKWTFSSFLVFLVWGIVRKGMNEEQKKGEIFDEKRETIRGECDAACLSASIFI